MSWLLKQAEDILNRVDQQTNAAIHQHGSKLTAKGATDESMPNTPVIESSSRNSSTANRTAITPVAVGNRRSKKSDDSQLIDYLNSSTSTESKPTRPLAFNSLLTDATRTASVPDMLANQSSRSIEKLSSKSASGTPRSTTPHDEDQGLVLVSEIICTFYDRINSSRIFHSHPNSNRLSIVPKFNLNHLPI